MAINFKKVLKQQASDAAEMRKTVEAANRQARDDLTTNQKTATTALNKSVPLQTDAINTGTNRQIGALDSAIGTQLDYGTQANNLLGGLYNDIQSEWTKYGDRADSAYNIYNDSMGLGGQQGYDNAVNTFQHSPGYQAALDEQLNAVMRNGAAGGNLNSGNTLMALQDRGRDMQNREYGSWQDRLFNQQNSLFNQQNAYDPQNAANNWAQGLSNLGNNISQLQGGQGAVYGNQGTALANVYGNQGKDLANSAFGFGSNLANTGLQGSQNYAQGLLGFGNLMNNTRGQQVQQQANQAAQSQSNLLPQLIQGGIGLLGGVLGA